MKKMIVNPKRVTASEDMTTSHCWFGVYWNAVSGKRCPIYISKSMTQDANEAAKLMEELIPAPYSKFRFTGTVSLRDAKAEGARELFASTKVTASDDAQSGFYPSEKPVPDSAKYTYDRKHGPGDSSTRAWENSVGGFYEKMAQCKTKAEVEAIVRKAKGNPNADEAYQKWLKNHQVEAAEAVPAQEYTTEEELLAAGYEALQINHKSGGKNYCLYRKMVNGKGDWYASDWNTRENVQHITYAQARGFEDINPTPVSRLGRELGKKLLPQTRVQSSTSSSGEISPEDALEYAIEQIKSLCKKLGKKKVNFVEIDDTQWSDRAISFQVTLYAAGDKAWSCDTFFSSLNFPDGSADSMDDVKWIIDRAADEFAYNLVNYPVAPSRPTVESAHFQVGDELSWSRLSGGSVDAVVTKVTNDQVFLDTSWISEDDGSTQHAPEVYEIETDPSGRECIVVWRYSGECGYMYPPRNRVTASSDIKRTFIVQQYMKEEDEYGPKFEKVHEADTHQAADEWLQKHLGETESSPSEFRIIQCSTITPSNSSISATVRQVIRKKVLEILQSESFGFPEDDAREYSRVVVTQEGHSYFRVEVRVELSYDSMWEMKELLDPIISKMDQDAYFDMDQPGIMSAYVNINKLKAWGNDLINITAAYIPEPPLEPPAETYRDGDDYEEVIEIDVEAEVSFEENGETIYAYGTWMENPDREDGNWVDDNGVMLMDSDQVFEEFDYLMKKSPNCPDGPGNYRVSGKLLLHFTVSGIYMEDDEYEQETYANYSEASATYDSSQSRIENLTFTEWSPVESATDANSTRRAQSTELSDGYLLLEYDNGTRVIRKPRPYDDAEYYYAFSSDNATWTICRWVESEQLKSFKNILEEDIDSLDDIVEELQMINAGIKPKMIHN